MANNLYQPKAYRTRGATALVAASGGTIEIQAGGHLNAGSGRITLPGNLRRGQKVLDLFSARALSSGEAILGASVSATAGNLGNAIGGLLNANSTPALAMFSSAAQAAHISWASAAAGGAIAFPPISIPPDFSSAGGLTIIPIAERASDNASNNVLDVRFWANNNATEQGTTGAPLTSSPAEVPIVVSSAEVGSHPGYWNIQIVPGTHTNNTVRLFSLSLEYDRVTS